MNLKNKNTWKTWSILLVLAVCLGFWPVTLSAAPIELVPLADNGSSFEQRSQAIKNYWREVLAVAPKGQSVYQVAPHTSAPYSAGSLNNEVINHGEKTLNFFRYLAGLPDDVQTTATLNVLTQHGALLNAVSEFSHTPSKPADMDQTLYNYGYQSTSKSNLSRGVANLELAIRGCMKDNDPSNIDRVGHRRWFLNPAMLYTGFGQVGTM
jgi:hypothetical protein